MGEMYPPTAADYAHAAASDAARNVKELEARFMSIESGPSNGVSVVSLRMQCIDIASRNYPSRSAEEIVSEANTLMAFVLNGKR